MDELAGPDPQVKIIGAYHSLESSRLCDSSRLPQSGEVGTIGRVKKQYSSTDAYTVLAVAFVSMLLISNIAATKLFAVDLGPWGLIFDGGAVLFPFTYVIGDVVAEVYGFAKARLMILLGFFASLLAALVFYLVQVLPPADDYQNQEAFQAVLGFVPRIVAASLAGYLVGQLLNAYVLVRLKERYGPDRLWVRLLTSSVVGEAADTVVFCLVAFYGILSGANLWNYVVVGYVYKMVFEVILMPVSYAAIRWLQSRHLPSEGEKLCQEASIG